MTFVPGSPKPPGSGRRKGQLGIRAKIAQQNLKSAIEICRNAGEDNDPISIMMNGARFLNTVAAAFAPKKTEGVDLDEVIRGTPVKDLERARTFLNDAIKAAAMAAEFGYAKLRRIDHVGDQPMVPTQTENVFEFVLNIDSNLPGRPLTGGGGNGHDGWPTIDCDARNGKCP